MFDVFTCGIYLFHVVLPDNGSRKHRNSTTVWKYFRINCGIEFTTYWSIKLLFFWRSFTELWHFPTASGYASIVFLKGRSKISLSITLALQPWRDVWFLFGNEEERLAIYDFMFVFISLETLYPSIFSLGLCVRDPTHRCACMFAKGI